MACDAECRQSPGIWAEVKANPVRELVIEFASNGTRPLCGKPEPLPRTEHDLRAFGRAQQAGCGLVIAAAVLLASIGPSDAHRTWSNGLPVPDWVERSCCGINDAHRLSPDQVHRVPDGYMIDGYPRVIFDTQVLPSEDGEYWAFYSENTDADGNRYFSSVFCFFAPTAG